MVLWLVVTIYAIIALSILYPLIRRGYFTASLVLGNFAIFILLFVLIVVQPSDTVALAAAETVRDELLFRPADLQTLRLHTIISSMFLHLDMGHIVFNVLALYLLGLPLEERIRGPAFGAIYLLTGVGATVIFGFVHWGSTTGALGASGAIMGIAGAFLALYPRDRIFMVLIFIILPRVPVYLAVGVIAAAQLVFLIFGAPGIAIEAHLAGLGVGILVGPLIHRPARKPRPMVALDLSELASSEELEEMLEVINNETVAEVRDAWVDHFLEKARCPRCQGPLRRDGRTVISDCGWRRRF